MQEAFFGGNRRAGIASLIGRYPLDETQQSWRAWWKNAPGRLASASRCGLWVEVEMIAINRRLPPHGRKIGGAIEAAGGLLVSL